MEAEGKAEVETEVEADVRKWMLDMMTRMWMSIHSTAINKYSVYFPSKSPYHLSSFRNFCLNGKCQQRAT